MTFVLTNDSLRRQNIIGFIGDAGTQTGIRASAVYQYGYVTADTAATVEGVGYFDAAGALLNVGDCIDAVMVANGTPVAKAYVVTANTVASGGHVTIALQLATAG